MASDRSEGCRNVLLVGFMGSGKTTVGTRLAERLGWTLLDFDDEIERRAGRSVAEIFASQGEATFRELERRMGEEVLGRASLVLVPGGGWPVASGRMDHLPADTLSVWLKVSPEVALARAERDGPTRPLLAGPGPLRRARALLSARTPSYERATLHLETDGTSPDALVQAIVDAMDAPASPDNP